MRILRLPNNRSFPLLSGFFLTKIAASGLSRLPYSNPFSQRDHQHYSNQILSPITTPPIFHDHLRLASSSNTLLLLLFTTSSCASCRAITPLLESVITSRTPQAVDRFSGVALAEVELDSPDRSNGSVADLGVEYGISSIPSLLGFGGRRAERVTDRVVDTKMMGDRERMEAWLDEWMEKGDPFRVDSGKGQGSGRGGVLGRLFGGN